jgi:hypothetical protein
MSKEKPKMTTKDKIAMWLVILIVFTFIFFLRQSEDSSFESCNKVTVADPIEVNGSFKRGFTLSYQYQYEGELYTSSNSIDLIDLVRFGQEYFLRRRYYIKVQCQNPRLTRVMWDISPGFRQMATGGKQ